MRKLIINLTMAACIGILSAGCSHSLEPEPASSSNIAVTADRDGLNIRNDSGETIYFTAFPTNILALILWAPCLNPVTCEKVLPGGTGRMSYDLIGDVQPGESITFYYWTLVRDGASRWKIENMQFIEVVKPESIASH